MCHMLQGKERRKEQDHWKASLHKKERRLGIDLAVKPGMATGDCMGLIAIEGASKKQLRTRRYRFLDTAPVWHHIITKFVASSIGCSDINCKPTRPAMLHVSCRRNKA